MVIRAWQEIEARKCPGCAGDLDETTHTDNEDAYDAHLVTCFKCAARQRTTEEFQQAGGKMAGVMVYTTEDPSITVSG